MLRAAIVAALLTLATPVAADTCSSPWQAIDIAHALERQGVGHGWAVIPHDDSTATGATSKADQSFVFAVACEADYEKLVESLGEQKSALFRNDKALVVAVFLHPLTAREAFVTRATLANLTP